MNMTINQNVFDPSSSLGYNVRYNHDDCGDKRGRLYVKRIPSGWVYHCHNCGQHGYKRSGNMSPAQMREGLLRSAHPESVQKCVALPYDCMPIPCQHKAWLYSYGLTDTEIIRYNISWSSSLARIILPVYHGEELVAFQARSNKEQPKYLTFHNGKRLPFITNLSSDKCVFVEDILSAIKVGRVAGAVALLGSYVPASIIDYAKNATKIFIWLDYDKKAESLKYAIRISQLIGRPVKPIITKLDPKCYSTEQITNYLY